MQSKIIPDTKHGTSRDTAKAERVANVLGPLYREWVDKGRPKRESPPV